MCWVAWTDELVRERRASATPVQVVMKNTFQAKVELPSAGDETCCRVQHTLEFVHGESRPSSDQVLSINSLFTYC